MSSLLESQWVAIGLFIGVKYRRSLNRCIADYKLFEALSGREIFNTSDC